jgi:hypothetical protein
MTSHPLLTPTASSLSTLLNTQLLLSSTSTQAAMNLFGGIRYKFISDSIQVTEIIPIQSSTRNISQRDVIVLTDSPVQIKHQNEDDDSKQMNLSSQLETS